MSSNHVDDLTLNHYLDGPLGLARRAEVDAHLAGCASCQARLEELRALFALLDAVPRESVPLERDLTPGVLDAIRQPRRQPRFALAFVAAAQTIVGLMLLGVAAYVSGLPLALNLAWLRPDSLAATAGEVLGALSTEWDALLGSARVSFETSLTMVRDLPVASLPAIELAAGLAVLSLLWLVGNGLLLRPGPGWLRPRAGEPS